MLHVIASRRTSLVAAMLIIGGGCTSRSGTSIEAPAQGGTSLRAEQAAPDGTSPQKSGDQTVQAADQGTLPVTLDQQALAKYADVGGDLTARLEYAGVRQDQPIKFVSGKARLQFSELPTGKTSTLSLTILEGDQARLSGSVQKFTMKEGSNHVALELTPVDGDTSATIDVEIGDDTGDASGDDSSDDSSDVGSDDAGGFDPGEPTGDDAGGVDPGDPLVVSFATDVTPILEKYCFSCHQGSQQSSMPDISKYPVAKQNVDLMISDIRSGKMPQGNTKLSSTDVEVLKTWKSDGLKP